MLTPCPAPDSASERSEAWAEVWHESCAGQPLPADHPLAEKSREVDQKVLANLLRLNRQRVERRS